MRIDLEDLYRANPKLFMGVSALIVAAFVFLIIEGVSSTGSNTHAARASRTTAAGAVSRGASSGVTVPSAGYHPSYSTNSPSTPADQKFCAEMGSSGQQTAAAEEVAPAPPAWTTEYPEIPRASTSDDETYLTAFLEELLDRNYAKQTRQSLARWVSAESADEMVPCSPAQAGDHVLYAELMDPAAVGLTPGPVPSASVWKTLAEQGVTQRAYDVFANSDPQWAELVSEGLTSADPLLTLDDVTGVLATTEHGKTTTRHFSLQVMVGSALHHPGYGVAGIEQWGVN